MGTLECQTTVSSVPRAGLDDFIAVRAARVEIAAADFARIRVGGGKIGPEWQALGGVIWALQLGAMLQLGIILGQHILLQSGRSLLLASSVPSHITVWPLVT